MTGGERSTAGLRLLPHAFLAARLALPFVSLPSLPFPLSHRGSSSSTWAGWARGEGAACVGSKRGNSVRMDTISREGWDRGGGSYVRHGRKRDANAGVREIWIGDCLKSRFCFLSFLSSWGPHLLFSFPLFFKQEIFYLYGLQKIHLRFMALFFLTYLYGPKTKISSFYSLPSNSAYWWC